MTRRDFLKRSTAAALAWPGLRAVGATPASAADYPASPVRMIVPYPAGGAADVVARIAAKHLSDQLGQQVFVDNRGGAGGTLGTEVAVRAAPDGYTLVMHTISSAVLNRFLYRKVNLDVGERFAPISQIGTVNQLLAVHPDVPAQNLQEFIALLKANPGKYSYASPGHGTSPHVACERLFKVTHGVDAVHVPFPGGGQAVQSTVAGHTAILHITLPLIAQHIKDGSLRALALASSTRSPLFPDLPTLEEAGVPNHEVAFWVGLLVPAGTPSSRIDALHQHIINVQSLAEVKERFASIGFEPVGSTPDEFAAHLKRESAEWARVVREGRINID